MTLLKGGVWLQHSRIDNVRYAISDFLQGLVSIKGFNKARTVVGMEPTGIYDRHLIQELDRIGMAYIIAGSAQIKSLLGNIRGKTDKLDSARIANFLFLTKDSLIPVQTRRNIIEELASLSTLRARLLAIQKTLRIPIKEDSQFILDYIAEQNRSFCARTVNVVADDLAIVEATIKKLWRSDERLNRLMTLILSVTSVGEITALQILITSNEFQTIRTAKQFACYSGIAPFPFQSGSSIRKRTRVSPIANRKMKALLHSCAVSAKKHVPELRAYYLRKTEVEGKHKMSVLNAIRCKLVSRVFTCVSQDRLYIRESSTPGEAKN